MADSTNGIKQGIARLLLSLSCALLNLSACSASGHADVGTQIGQHALSFRVPQLGGGEGEIAAHHGEIVVVNLWASWCPPCREELPALERVMQHEKKHAIVIGIDQGDDPKLVQRIVTNQKLTYPILLDHDQKYGANYATLGLPTSLLLDRDGRIRLIISGAAEERDFERGIAAIEKNTSHVVK